MKPWSGAWIYLRAASVLQCSLNGWLRTFATYRTGRWVPSRVFWEDIARERDEVIQRQPSVEPVGQIEVELYDGGILRDLEYRVRQLMGQWYDRTISVPVTSCPSLQLNLLSRGHIQKWMDGCRDCKRLHIPSVLWDVSPLLADAGASWEDNVLVRVGDFSHEQPCYPVLAKSGPIVAASEEDNVVIIPLNVDRHMRGVQEVRLLDRPWAWKNNDLRWRGAASGGPTYDETCGKFSRFDMLHNYNDHVSGFCNVYEDGKCTITYRELELVLDMKFVIGNIDFPHSQQIEGPGFNTASLAGDKIIISVEGNDVATNIRWAMASSSVVFMPKPTARTAFLEQLLEPWVHYVPIESPDFSDIPDKVHWCLVRNRVGCQQIARNSMVFADLVLDQEMLRSSGVEAVRRYLLNVSLDVADGVYGVPTVYHTSYGHLGVHDPTRAPKSCSCELDPLSMPIVLPPPLRSPPL